MAAGMVAGAKHSSIGMDCEEVVKFHDLALPEFDGAVSSNEFIQAQA